MSLDHRLGAGLARSAAAMEFDAAQHLPEALARGRRRRRALRVRNSALLSTALLLVAAVSGVFLTQLSRHGGDRTATTTPPSRAYLAVAGTYEADVESDTPLVRTTGLVGTWTLTLTAGGRLDLTPPPGFSHPTASAWFTVDGSRLRTAVTLGGLCTGRDAVYEYGISEGRLRLGRVTDSCPARAALLAGRQWRLVSPASPGRSSTSTDGLPYLPDDGSLLPPGRYQTSFLPRLEIDAPPGWTGNADTTDWVDIRHGSAAMAGDLAIFRIESVADPRTGRSEKLPADLVAWFAANPSLQVVTAPTPTTVGGRSATRLDVALAPRWRCHGDGCAFAPLQVGEPGFGWGTDAATRVRARLYVIRVPRAFLVIEVSAGRGRFAAEAKAADAAVRTLTLG